jgi:hypothetical protein
MLLLETGLVLWGLVATATALYGSGDAVVDLTPANFDKQARMSIQKSTVLQQHRFLCVVVLETNLTMKKNLIVVRHLSNAHSSTPFFSEKCFSLKYRYPVCLGNPISKFLEVCQNSDPESG